MDLKQKQLGSGVLNDFGMTAVALAAGSVVDMGDSVEVYREVKQCLKLNDV